MGAGTRLGWIGMVLLGCREGDEDGGTSLPAEADADADADTDADTDLDSGDTGSADVDATGDWLGGCEGTVVYTPGSTTDGAYDLALALVDQRGHLAGTGTITSEYGGEVYVTEMSALGTREEDRVLLRFVDESTGSSYYAPVELRLVLDGDAMAGEIVYFPNGTYGNPTFALACTLTR